MSVCVQSSRHIYSSSALCFQGVGLSGVTLAAMRSSSVSSSRTSEVLVAPSAMLCDFALPEPAAETDADDSFCSSEEAFGARPERLGDAEDAEVEGTAGRVAFGMNFATISEPTEAVCYDLSKQIDWPVRADVEG